MISISERMTKDVASCTASDNLEMAATLLWQNDCGCAPVVDQDGHVLGMITDRDICMAAWSSGKRLAELSVGDTMARDVASIGAIDSLHEAELVMRRRGVHRLPVVDEQHRVIGILCSNDLLRWVADGGALGSTADGAAQLVCTLATIGRPRTAVGAPYPAGAAEAASHAHLATGGPGRSCGETGPRVAQLAMGSTPQNQCEGAPGPVVRSPR